MKVLFSLAVLGLYLFGGGVAPANLESDLRSAVLDVMALRDEAIKGGSISSDKANGAISMLTQVLNAAPLNNAGKSIIHFWRGEARRLLNESRQQNKQPIDLDLARAALADYDVVIANGIGVKVFDVAVSGAAYSAGTVAFNMMKAVPLAYSYFDKCAEQNHMGCINVMASAKLTGHGGQEIDIPRSIELHQKVYETGTRFSCAGAFSARSIALIEYFNDVKRGPDDPLVWFTRAYSLLDSLGSELRTENPCRRTVFEIYEYLMRLSRDERKPELLERAVNRSTDGEPTRTVAQFLRGEMDEAAVTKIAGSVKHPYERCAIHFSMVWYGKLKSDEALVQRHHRMLLDNGENCPDEMAYSKKYGL